MTSTQSPATRPGAREIGLVVGHLPTGRSNAITDVAGVRVGHATVWRGEGPLHPGEGPVRTGVTVILPHGDDLFREKVRAAAVTINGFGKVVGFEQVRELGLLESPIALTNTLNAGLVADALIEHAVRDNPEIGVTTGTVAVVVGETNDGYLNDIQGRHVRAEHVRAALHDAADGPVAEGAVGAGAGTSCFGWKGGIGTASRHVSPDAGGYVVGALVQSNFGEPADLTICGVPVGRHLMPAGSGGAGAPERGSIMVVLATDAPLESRQLGRLAARATAGLARTGSCLEHGSGDFVIAFSTAHRIPHWAPAPTRTESVVIDEGLVMRWLFPAVVESVEEAILNSLCRAVTVRGRDDHVRHALPVEEVVRVVAAGRSGRA